MLLSLLATAAVAIVASLVFWCWPSGSGHQATRSAVHDSATAQLLDAQLFEQQEQRSAPDADLTAFAKLTSSLPLTHDIATCAAQMQQLIRSGLLHYDAHVHDPERILKASGLFHTDHAALITRFTVQYNLYAGSVAALGTDQQRQELFDSEQSAELGCFAFTEVGAGVMTGVRVDTRARFDRESDQFVFDCPTPEARKNWISQGSTASKAVVLARLIVDDTDLGAHLFWVPLRHARAAADAPDAGEFVVGELLPGIEVSLVAAKNAMLALDNAVIDFTGYTAPRSSLLSRFCSLDRDGKYCSSMPAGCRRVLDLVLTRLLTGRLCLAEYALKYAMILLRHNWAYCSSRSLFRGEQKMSNVLAPFFVDRIRTLRVLLEFIIDARGIAAQCIKNGAFTNAAVELASVAKFVCTGTATDTILALRYV
jgi:acyl-CoA oxidase